MLKLILKELKQHAPFTACGAISGIILLFFCRQMPVELSQSMFYILHPFHVLLSALVTASMYKLNTRNQKTNILLLLFIGYAGSIGIATVSDSIIPYFGELFLGMPHAHIHLGFIEKWWLVNPLALLGVAIAYFKPATKFPHLGHVLLSTWASLFHVLMAAGKSFGVITYIILFFVLFIAVWAPCCLSDIVFPLLFVKQENKKHL